MGQLDDNDALLLYGGSNTKNPPFNIGDKLKQIWRIDDNEYNIKKNGREFLEYLGMENNMMILKTLNTYAAYCEDTMTPDQIFLSRSNNISKTGKIFKLHYKFADRYIVIASKK
jgi:hypothetical protein